MHHTQDPGKASPTDGTQGVNRLSMQEHTASGNAGTKYHRLLHRHCASLDLETAFKQIKISQDIQPDLCKECQTEKCRCPAFTPEMPCSSASSMPTKLNSDQEDIPELVDNQTGTCTISTKANAFRRGGRLRSSHYLLSSCILPGKVTTYS